MQSVDPELLKKLYDISSFLLAVFLLKVVFDFVKWVISQVRSAKANKELRESNGLVELIREHIIQKLDGIKSGTEKIVSQNKELIDVTVHGFRDIDNDLNGYKQLVKETKDTLEQHNKRQLTEENLSGIKIMLKKIGDYFKLT